MTERNDATGRWTTGRSRPATDYDARDVLHDLEHESAALAALAEQGDTQAASELRALGRYLLTRLAKRKTEQEGAS